MAQSVRATSAAVLAALGLGTRLVRGQEAEGEVTEAPPEEELVPMGPEASATQVPALQKTILLDADWIGTDNARGRHTQFWVDSWLARNPSYKIDLQDKGDVIVRLASDTYGHLIQFPPTIFAVFKGKPGLFVDITPEMERRGIAESDIFFNEGETWDGKRFGLPLQMNLFGWMYNRTKFENIGAPLPTDRWTYDDAIEAGKRFARPDDNPPQWGLRWLWNWGIIPILRAAGVQYVSEDRESVRMNTPEGVAAWEFILGAIHRHRVAPTEKWQTDNNAAFAPADVMLGYYAMLDNSIGSKATQRLVEPKGIKFENMWPPTWRATGRRSVLTGGHPWLVMDRAAADGVEAAATDLVLHLLDEAVQMQYVEQGTSPIPALKRLARDERFIGGPPDTLRLIPDVWEFGQPYDRFAGEIDMLNAWTPLIKRAWNGEIGAGELAAQMTRDGTAAIQNVRRPPWGR
jgi:ABC-type glycerol-3-phosphate transport system substrate-binding protein